MTISLCAGEPVYGSVEPRMLRAAARQLCMIEAARPHDLAVVLGVPEKVAMPIWEKLVEEGRIARDDAGHWRPTAAMLELANTRLARSVGATEARPRRKRYVMH